MKITVTVRAVSRTVQRLVRLCRVCGRVHSDEGYDKTCRKCWGNA